MGCLDMFLFLGLNICTRKNNGYTGYFVGRGRVSCGTLSYYILFSYKLIYYIGSYYIGGYNGI